MTSDLLPPTANAELLAYRRFVERIHVLIESHPPIKHFAYAVPYHLGELHRELKAAGIDPRELRMRS